MIFNDRRHAGKELGEKLRSLSREGTVGLDDAIVIALPRGGVPVGYEVARALGVPLDICVVRKVGAPHQPELAVAAVSEGDEIVINEEISRSLGLSHEEIENLAKPRQLEVRDRVDRFRAGREALTIENRTIILVDDGVATGATALSAVHVLKKMQAGRIILALPVCPASTAARFRSEVDHLVILSTPDYFYAVGQFYHNFDQTSDREVQNLLKQAREGLPE